MSAMIYYSVSQIVKLIQENLHNPEYYDVDKSSIENRIQQLIHHQNPKKYPPVTQRSKYSLDEAFKDEAIRTLTQFDRKRIPTKKEQLINDLDVEYLEDKSQWFKLSKLYVVLDKKGLIPEKMTVRTFWTRAHKELKSFERIYIKTIRLYTQFPNTAVVHYRVDDLIDILKHLNNQKIIYCEELINEL